MVKNTLNDKLMMMALESANKPLGNPGVNLMNSPVANNANYAGGTASSANKGGTTSPTLQLNSGTATTTKPSTQQTTTPAVTVPAVNNTSTSSGIKPGNTVSSNLTLPSLWDGDVSQTVLPTAKPTVQTPVATPDASKPADTTTPNLDELMNLLRPSVNSDPIVIPDIGTKIPDLEIPNFNVDASGIGQIEKPSEIPQYAVPNAAMSMLQSNYTPGTFEWDASTMGAARDEAKNNYLNQKPFAYDINADALYQQYKNQYMQAGKLAMMDSMAQASAMTGGYGNSYAANVGNQAYQASMQELNNKIPELYQMAYDRYQNDRADLYNRYQLENNEYNQAYQNAFNLFNANESNKQFASGLDLDYAQLNNNINQFNESQKLAYEQLNNNITNANNELKYKYDALNQSNSQFAQDLALQQQKLKDANAQTAEEFALKMAQLGATKDKDGNYVIKPTLPSGTSSARTQSFVKAFENVKPNTANGENYSSFIVNKIGEWFEAGKLTEQDVLWLWGKYGIN